MSSAVMDRGPEVADGLILELLLHQIGCAVITNNRYEIAVF